MRAEQWEEIKRIFDSAVKLSLSDRDGYLASACSGKPDVLETVSELLQAHDQASGFLNEESAKPALPAVFEVGQLVAERFRIVRLISRGGMGEVYETFDERLSVLLALKTLRPEYAGDVDALERFRREIRVTRDISHPSLCRVYELVEHRETAGAGGGRIITCLTMQLMAGENLQQYVGKSGRLSPNSALPLIKEIAGAVGVLHENGIVHRDLKPSNVMITPTPSGELRAIVMDFGLAKPFSAEREVFESRSDFNAGAPFFLAPELVRGERPSIASDIYAFGLIIDDMVTGGGAFAGETVEAILYQKLWGDPTDPSTRAPDLPENWCATIRLCLNRNPAKRPSSTLDVVRRLTDTPSKTQRVPPFYRVLGRLGRWYPRIRQRRPWRLGHILIACAVLAIAVSTFIGILGSPPLNTSVVTYEFENETGKPENDYLTKGITREFERRLLQMPDVTVLPYHGVRLKDSRVNTKARFSIDGQLQANKDVAHLSVQVIENTTGKLVCCDSVFENISGDTLEMQSVMASSVVAAMRDSILLPNAKNAGGVFPEVVFNLLHIVPVHGAQKALAAPTNSSVAMQFYMKAHFQGEQRTLSSLQQAVDLYKKAIKEDGNFALAYAELAGVELALLQINFAGRAQMLDAAKTHAQLAVAKGPGYAESYAALAATAQNSWDWHSAEQYFKHALTLNPKLASAHRNYGGFLLQFGRFDEALSEARRANALEPFDDEANRFYLGFSLLYSGKAAEAVSLLQEWMLQRDYAQGHNILGFAYAMLALRATGAQRTEFLDLALKEANALAKEDPSGAAVPMYAQFYGLRGDRQRASGYLRILLKGQANGTVDPMDLAHSYVSLGEPEAALKALTRAVKARDSGMIYLKVDPFLEPLRSSREFQALVSQMGL